MADFEFTLKLQLSNETVYAQVNGFYEVKKQVDYHVTFGQVYNCISIAQVEKADFFFFLNVSKNKKTSQLYQLNCYLVSSQHRQTQQQTLFLFFYISSFKSKMAFSGIYTTDRFLLRSPACCIPDGD